MNRELIFEFEVDMDNVLIHVRKEFTASLELVWRAYTDSEILDKWWAPLPWKTQTKEMNFVEGGRWLYAMVGPEGEKHWSRADYKRIKAGQFFEASDAFCKNEEGEINEDFPRAEWKTSFESRGDSLTLVEIRTRYTSKKDLEAVVQMGMKEGFTMALEQLEDLLSKPKA